jgi:hypothetical protein
VWRKSRKLNQARFFRVSAKTAIIEAGGNQKQVEEFK